MKPTLKLDAPTPFGSATEVVPASAPVTDTPLPPKAAAGVKLAKWVLCIFSCFTFFTLCILVWSESRYNGLLGATFNKAFYSSTDNEAIKALNNLATTISADRTGFRDLWVKFYQIVGLNILLPVLTALLGYVFGAKEGSA